MRVWRAGCGAAFALVVALAAVAPPAESAFPGANGKIAYQSCCTAGIGLVDESGDASVPGTKWPADGYPAWSPDGTKIAFVRSGIDAGIYVMRPDGSGVVRLTQRFDVLPAWSPDGTKIAFASIRGGGALPQIYIMDADGSDVVRLATTGAGATDPKWSPDGQSIAFISYTTPEATDVALIHVDGTGQRRLTTTEGALDLDWSPDGRKIVFTAWKVDGRPGSPQLYVMRADGTAQTHVPTPSPAVDVAWSPDGQRLAFTWWDGIWVMNEDGTDPHRLPLAASQGIYIDWQPLVTAPAQPPRAPDGVFLCYSKWQVDPGVWLFPLAADLLRSGYWRPYAISGQLSATRLGPGGAYSLVCNLPPAVSVVPGLAVDDGGELVAGAPESPGLYPLAR